MVLGMVSFFVNGQPFYVKSVTEYPNKPASNSWLTRFLWLGSSILNYFTMTLMVLRERLHEVLPRYWNSSKVVWILWTSSTDLYHQVSKLWRINETLEKCAFTQWIMILLHQYRLTSGLRKWDSSTKGMFGARLAPEGHRRSMTVERNDSRRFGVTGRMTPGVTLEAAISRAKHGNGHTMT